MTHRLLAASFKLGLLLMVLLLMGAEAQTGTAYAQKATAAESNENAPVEIALKADTGKYLARCRGCFPKATTPDVATVHVMVDSLMQVPPYARFRVIKTGDGRIALQVADLGTFLARCRGCVSGATSPDAATMHVEDWRQGNYAQFTPVRLSNGKYAFRADNGQFLARCRGCVPGATQEDSAMMHVVDPEMAPWAQWEVVMLF